MPLQLLFLLQLLLLLLQSVEAVADRVGVASLEHLLDPGKKASEGRVHTARLTAWLTGRLAAGLTHVSSPAMTYTLWLCSSAQAAMRPDQASLPPYGSSMQAGSLRDLLHGERVGWRYPWMAHGRVCGSVRLGSTGGTRLVWPVRSAARTTEGYFHRESWLCE